jgi:hypothetical protein
MSLVNDAEGNWAIASYVTLVPLAARLGVGRSDPASRRHARAGIPAWTAAWIVRGFSSRWGSRASICVATRACDRQGCAGRPADGRGCAGPARCMRELVRLEEEIGA